MEFSESGGPVVLLDMPQRHVARLRINRPARRNAIDQDVRQGLIDALARLHADTQVRALVLGGVQQMFSAGGDLSSMSGLDEAGARARMRHIAILCRLLAGSRLPVVSAMEGVAAGAAVGLALLGDRIVVGPGTRILFPFLRLGLAPFWGLWLTLPRRVGIGAARRILASGQAVGGDEALTIGLADECVDDARVMDTAIERAAELARLPGDAFARMKQRLSSPSASLDDELQREENDQAVLLLADDFGEGFAAFAAKREPDFLRQEQA